MEQKGQEWQDGGIQFLNVPKDTSVNIIKVIGVGGGGCNAVRNMFLEGITNVTFAVMNTDSQQLAKSPVPVKLQLGADGLGAGGKPERGLQEAQNTAEQIRALLSDGTKMVFVTASMGGGTGTGAAPFVAKIAKEMGLLTIGIVTIPFAFEGRRKIIMALRGVEEMRKNVDALLIINNESLGRGDKEEERVPMKTEYKRADNILKDAAKSISELITIHSDGDINLDFCDVDTTMRNGGGAIMAMGTASGEHRVERAILNALDSPLLYGNDVDRAKRILFAIYASDEAPLYNFEMHEVQEFMDRLDIDIELIWGTSTDNTLGQEVKVIILATGIEDDLHGTQLARTSQERDDDFYLELMGRLYRKKGETGEGRTKAEAEAEAANTPPTQPQAMEGKAEEPTEPQAGEEKAEAANTPPTKPQAGEEKAEAANTPPTKPQAMEERAEAANTPPTKPQAGEEEKTQAEEGKKGAPELSKWKKMLEELWVFLAKMTNPETH